MRCNIRQLLLGLGILLLAGCGHFRYAAIAERQATEGVDTEGRYRLVGFARRAANQYERIPDGEFRSLWAVCKFKLPTVFSEDGKPIFVYLDSTDGRDTKYGWTLLFPYLVTMGVLPCWNQTEWRSHYSIRFRNPKKSRGLRNAFSVKMMTSWNMSFLGPCALFFPFGEPEEKGLRTCMRTQTHVMGSADAAKNQQIAYEAIAYGAACALRRLEQDGMMPDFWGDEPRATVGAPSAASDVAPPPAAEVQTPASSSDRVPSVPAPVVEIDEIPL